MTPTEEAVLFVCTLMLWFPALPSNCAVYLRWRWKTETFCGEILRNYFLRLNRGNGKRKWGDWNRGDVGETVTVLWMSRRLKWPLPPRGCRRFILPAGSVRGSIRSEGLWRERTFAQPRSLFVSFSGSRSISGFESRLQLKGFCRHHRRR